jgi:transposase-like protein
MPCPRCASNNLRIRQATGLEFLVLLFISKRRYTCRECDKVFRAPDRRQSRRDEAANAVTARRFSAH